jgi:multiple sugar transport system ATP-binding protein
MARVSLQGFTKRFGRNEVIRGVDLEIESGELCVLVGPSGCGKSTLLRMIAGLEDIDAGTLMIDGKAMNKVRPADRGVSMVFQSYALYPHMTVYRNMAFGLKLAKTDKAGIDARVRAAAKTLQIEDLLDRLPRALSGGQRQRVAIGRAIVREPEVFLLDEPLSNLDAALRVQMRLEIAELHERLGTTIVYVTHDQVEAMTLADKIVVLNDGRVEQVGPPLDLYYRPANRFVAGFIGSPRMNFLPATVAARRDDAVAVAVGDATLTLPGCYAVALGETVTLGIRPEHIRVDQAAGAAADTLAFRVGPIEELGESRLLHGTVGDGTPVTVRDHHAGRIARGERIEIGIPNEFAVLFDGDGKRL